jgi:hypothetical protein
MSEAFKGSHFVEPLLILSLAGIPPAQLFTALDYLQIEAFVFVECISLESISLPLSVVFLG